MLLQALCLSSQQGWWCWEDLGSQNLKTMEQPSARVPGWLHRGNHPTGLNVYPERLCKKWRNFISFKPFDFKSLFIMSAQHITHSDLLRWQLLRETLPLSPSKLAPLCSLLHYSLPEIIHTYVYLFIVFLHYYVSSMEEGLCLCPHSTQNIMGTCSKTLSV